jgi:hypothetical protein
LGIAKVTLDGVSQTVDLYSPTWQFQQIVFERTDLAQGKHWIALSPSGQKNIASSGTTINVDAIDTR